MIEYTAFYWKNLTLINNMFKDYFSDETVVENFTLKYILLNKEIVKKRKINGNMNKIRAENSQIDKSNQFSFKNSSEKNSNNISKDE